MLGSAKAVLSKRSYEQNKLSERTVAVSHKCKRGTPKSGDEMAEYGSEMERRTDANAATAVLLDSIRTTYVAMSSKRCIN